MFAVLHAADFALQAVLRTAPAPADRPAALFADTGKKSLVRSVNPAARAAGVEPGMNAPQALARCPALRVCTPHPAAETEARAALHAVAFRLSPVIEDTAPGVSTVDLRGANPARRLATATAAIGQLRALALVVTVGLARTPLLALYAARSTPGVQQVGDEKAFLAPLPLTATDASPALLAILRQWGLATCGHLTALPRDAIIQRFGAAGLALWNRASGGTPRPLAPVIPSRRFRAHTEFEHAVETLEPLLFILQRLLDRLVLELATAHFAAAEIHLILTLENEKSVALDLRLPEPASQAGLLFRTLHTRLESLQTGSAIVALALELTPIRPLVRQPGIFETGLRDPHGFSETLARLAALVGAGNIGTPQLENTHRPDAVRLAAPPAVVPPPAAAPVHAPLGPPLRRFRPPLPARLEFTEGRPSYLWTGPIKGEIARHTAACRSSGDWWQDDRHWQRTEWDLELVRGGLYRLLLVGESWFLEGEYD